MSQLVWRKWHHASLRLGNVLNHHDGREDLIFVKDHFSKRYFCKRLSSVPGTLYIIFLYPNHRVQKLSTFCERLFRQESRQWTSSTDGCGITRSWNWKRF
jgi:hypothetical protein